jgi:tetratricopeptide (TPR) repeat protein
MQVIRNILFSVIIIAVFFGGAELLLAVAGVKPLLLTQDPLVGFAGNVPQFVKVSRKDGTEMYITPRNKSGYFNFQEFPQHKSDDAYRIFCVGGSTTYGRPYTHKVSFCGWLQAYLEAADPLRKWEVINVGGITYASYRVARMMNELVNYQPDMFIVYTGQNEFLEKRSYGALQELPAWMIGLDASLSATRVYTAMKLALDALRQGRNKVSQKADMLPDEVDDIMSHTMGPETYQRDEKLREATITHFRINLKRIADIADSTGAEKIFIVPAKQLRDLTPFKSEHRNDIEPDELMHWLALYSDARELQQDGKLEPALAKFNDAMAIDDRFAELHYRIGEVMFDQRNYEQAELAFRRAVDEDVTPLRILAPMQQIVHEVAEDEGDPLIDFPALLRRVYMENYGHGIFGSEFFVDHVHFTIEGHRLIGRALFEQLVAQGIAHPDAGWDETGAERVRQQVLASLDNIDISNSYMALGIIFEWAAKYDEAEKMLLRALDALGPDEEIYMRLANTYYGKGELDKAYDYLVKINELAPDRPIVHARFAMILLEQGKPDKAIDECRTEMEIRPDNYIAAFCMAMAHAALGDAEKAQTYFDRTLEMETDNLDVHIGYADFLIQQQRYDEALTQAQAALDINPASYEAHNTLGGLLLDRGDREKAWQHIVEALRLEPDYAPAMENLRRYQG